MSSPCCTPIAERVISIKGNPYCAGCGRSIKQGEADQVERLGTPPRRPDNPWGRGIRRDERGIALLDKNGKPLRLGESYDPRDYGNEPIRINTKGLK